MPQISVIVPVYKVEDFLGRCIDSVLVQTFSDFELILVDDGSPDSSGQICDEYAGKDPRILVIHKENGGVATARNAGIDWVFAHSDSQWLAFIDSDDWIHPEYLERLLNAASDCEAGISVCGYATTEGEEPMIAPEELNPTEWKTESFFVERNVNATVPWAKLYRRECFRGFRYPAGRIAEDEFLTYQILFQFPTLTVISAPLYYYYVVPNRESQSVSGYLREDKYEALEQQIQYFQENGFMEACRCQIRIYMMMVRDKMLKLLDEPENRDFLKIMKRRKRQHFSAYARLLDPKQDNDGYVLTEVFPKRMWIYWHVRAVLRKLRIIK